MRAYSLSCLLVVAVSLSAVASGPVRAGGGVRHFEVLDEGLYFDVPKLEVAYNVRIIRLESGGFATVYHGEPRKPSLPKVGDSVKVALESGPFRFRMPDDRHYAIHGDPSDPRSVLYSTDPMMGGAANPIVVKGKDGDPYYYIFFIAVPDDDGDWEGADFRNALCQARTKDFREFDLRVIVDGKVEWKAYRVDTPPEWKRAWVLRDATGERICGPLPRALPDTKGLIGSICLDGGIYHYFYTARDTDGRFYLFYRSCPDVASVADGRTEWSAAERLSAAIPTGTVIRVAKTKDGGRWAVLYNGYRETADGLRQALFLRYTRDASIRGPDGIAGINWFERFNEVTQAQGVSDSPLALRSGNRTFSQHDFLTDPYGALTGVPEEDPGVGGLLTWADFSRGVYGGGVFWARWNEPQ